MIDVNFRAAMLRTHCDIEAWDKKYLIKDFERLIVAIIAKTS